MSSGKILFVDDEPQIRRVVRVILAGAGYEVVDARSGEAALLRFREFLPDLVLLDLKMPKLSGFDVLAYIRQRPDLKDLPVIVFTASTLAKSGKNCGGSCHLLRAIE